jgi:hypothetical protein
MLRLLKGINPRMNDRAKSVVLRVGRWGRATVLAGSSLLVACGLGSSSAPTDPPTGVHAIAGDGQVTLTWDAQPGVEYWIFWASDPSINLGNWYTLPNPGAYVNAVSPQPVPDKAPLSNGTTYALTNGTTYTFLINAHSSSGQGGPASIPVSATPRLAGVTYQTGAPISSAALNGVVGADTWISGVRYHGIWAVGAGGQIYESTNGVNWAALASNTSSNLNAIGYGSNIWIAVGDGGIVDYSLDGGTTWNPVASGTGYNLRAVTVFNGHGLAVGDNGVVAFASGANPWGLQTSPTTWTLRAVTVGSSANSTSPPTLAVAVGDHGTIIYSSNGGTWYSATSNTTEDLYGVAWSSTLLAYVAVGKNGTILYSTNGMTWNPVATGLTTQNLTAVVFGSRFVAVGEHGAAAYSDDGQNWTLANTGSSVSFTSVAWGLNQYTAVGPAGANVYSQ